MNDPNTAKRFFTRQFHSRWRQVATIGATLVLALGLCQLALAQDPVITLHPTNQTVCEGGNVMMSVQATSTKLPMTFQWQRDDTAAPMTFTNIPNAIGGRLSLRSVTANDTGDYRVIVANAAGDSVTSQVAKLTVEPKLFIQVTEGPHVTDLGCSGFGEWGDYDGDGYADLSVNRLNNHGTSCVYRNNGDGTFSRLTNPPTLPGVVYFGPWGDWDNDGKSEGMVWGADGRVIGLLDSANTMRSMTLDIVVEGWDATVDYDRDGFLDAYFTTGNNLCRNVGGLGFSPVSDPEGVGVWTYGGASWGDFDDDGWPDLYLGNLWFDRSYMFRNDGTGRFLAVDNLVTQTVAPAFKGAWGDYDNDGRLDLCVVSFQGTTTVYRNLGGGQFERPADVPSVVGPHNFATWVDFNNDGFLDLSVSAYVNGNKLFRNNGDGSFATVTTESLVTDRPIDGGGTYSVAWFDYDNNGFLDAYVLNGRDDMSVWTANQLYRNSGNQNAWLTVKPIGKASNRQGIGAKVRVLATYAGQARWQRRDISGGGLDNGCHRYAHFGLGDATKVDTLRIEWPSGIVQELKDVAVNQQLEVVESQGVAMTEPLVIQDWDRRSTTMSCPVDGVRCVLETSVDLEHWSKVKVQTSAGGTVKFAYVDASRAPTRFYRVLVP